MTRAIKIQKLESLLSMLQEFASDTDNGTQTIIHECVKLVAGKLRSLRGKGVRT